MARVLKDLVLALLNATLILVALCLFLAWKVTDTFDGMTLRLGERLDAVSPLRDEIKGVRSDIQDLRGDMESLRTLDGSAAQTAALAALNTKLTALDEKIEIAQNTIAGFGDTPDNLIDHTVDATATATATLINDLRGCVPAS